MKLRQLACHAKKVATVNAQNGLLSQVRIPIRSFSTIETVTMKEASEKRFDLFQELKDPPDEKKKTKQRKPSEKVKKLCDDILSLTLQEAADLCDLCQEKLSPGDNAALIPGRMPFPHPGGMFSPQFGMPPAMMAGMPMPAMPAGGMPAMPAAGGAAPAAAAPAAEEAAPEEDKKAAADVLVSLKLISFEASKKIGVIKEVRGITALGLKESKEMVESAPKVLKKGVPRAEAEALAEKLKKAGAVVELV